MRRIGIAETGMEMETIIEIEVTTQEMAVEGPAHNTYNTYKEFLNFQPLNFKGTEGAVGLAHRTIGHDAAYEMPWKNLMKMMTEAYCPRSKIKKLEIEMVPNESDKVEKYVGGLPDSIQGNVMSASPKMLQEAIELATSLIDQKVRAYDAKQTDNKRRMDNDQRGGHVQQLPYKRQNVARAYTAGPNEKKECAGTLPFCNKCKYHHTGPCTAKCRNCKRIGHQTKDCRSLAAATNHRAPVAIQRTLTCFECGKQRHYRSEYPKLKNIVEAKLEVVKHMEGCML
ncbi:putative reverse transcriptase domain-containing protein [Tanacetum coccineum]